MEMAVPTDPETMVIGLTVGVVPKVPTQAVVPSGVMAMALG